MADPTRIKDLPAAPALTDEVVPVDSSAGVKKATLAQLTALSVPLAQRGAADGVATLGADSKVPSAQLPPDSVLSVDGATGAVVLAADGPAGTATKRTLGAGATQAAAGNDARLSDARVPVDGSVATAKLADNAVTLAKLADIATARILGRVTAAAGDPEELTAAQVKTLLAIVAGDISDFDARVATTAVLKSLVDAAGDLLVGTADNTVGRLAKGAALDVLRVNAGATALEWAAPSGGSAFPVHKRARRATARVINGTAWVDFDNTLDLVIPDVLAGHVIEVAAMGGYVNEARFSYLDAVTIVATAPVSSFGEQGAPPANAAGGGVPGWAGNSGSYFPNITGGATLVLAAGDIAAGSVTLRLRCRTDAAGNKTTNAGFLWWARNLGPVTA